MSLYYLFFKYLKELERSFLSWETVEVDWSSDELSGDTRAGEPGFLDTASPPLDSFADLFLNENCRLDRDFPRDNFSLNDVGNTDFPPSLNECLEENSGPEISSVATPILESLFLDDD